MVSNLPLIPHVKVELRQKGFLTRPTFTVARAPAGLVVLKMQVNSGAKQSDRSAESAKTSSKALVLQTDGGGINCSIVDFRSTGKRSRNYLESIQ